jgi:hypothetical protein
MAEMKYTEGFGSKAEEVRGEAGLAERFGALRSGEPRVGDFRKVSKRRSFHPNPRSHCNHHRSQNRVKTDGSDERISRKTE